MHDQPVRYFIHKVGTGPKGREDLTPAEAREVMRRILTGAATPIQAAVFLHAMRMKGTTPDELAAFTQVVREHSTRIAPQVDGLVGASGPYDGRKDYFNASAGASIVAAAAGAPCVSEGGKNIPMKNGVTAGDILEALGVPTELDPFTVERQVERVGVGYLSESQFCPRLYALRDMRWEIGLRTPLNTVEHILNPAHAPFQLTGVAHKPYAQLLASALQKLGCRRALIVHSGLEGSEDVSTHRRANVCEVTPEGIKEFVVNSEEWGMSKPSADDLRGGDAPEQARVTQRVLEGAPCPQRDLVLLNAALRIYLGGKAATIPDGLRLATEAVDSGAARERLAQWQPQTARRPRLRLVSA